MTDDEQRAGRERVRRLAAAALSRKPYGWDSKKPDFRWLPDGRFELTLEECVPVVLSAATFFAQSPYRRWQILKLLAVYAGYFAAKHGYQLAERPGRFVEFRSEFVFSDRGSSPRQFLRLTVPRHIVISQGE